jgi:hypothetical protein
VETTEVLEPEGHTSPDSFFSWRSVGKTRGEVIDRSKMKHYQSRRVFPTDRCVDPLQRLGG